MNLDVVIWVLVIGFLAYFIISRVFKKLNLNNLIAALQVTNGLRLLNLKHLLGIIFFGILPFVLIPDLRFLVFNIEILRLHLLIIFLFLVFFCVYIACLGVRNESEILEADSVCFYHFREAGYYFVVRFVFLLCYEFFFRGIMLFFFLEFSSLWLAICCVTVFYVLIHFFDSKKEMLGAIPFGIVLCLLAFYTDSIWYPFILHLTLSAVYEISIFYQLTLKNKSES
ncbi:CPBP family intramembrane glutamic endopeptidase [Aestuariibaculum suncheonense]|uniref:CPBP family intramembrane glutamic endopeptidase n=1 Tax=Aestuariibaculum suncheonense TaxID=1028745 RepID=UPI0037439E53